jgi:hypothetical protein
VLPLAAQALSAESFVGIGYLAIVPDWVMPAEPLRNFRF